MNSTEIEEDDINILILNGFPDKTRYTVPEISTILGIPEKTVYGWHYTGKYEACKLGGARFYHREVVIKILQDSTSID